METPLIEQFLETGFVGPIRIFSTRECRDLHQSLSAASGRHSPADWAKGYAASSHVFHGVGTHPAIVSVVSELLGENVMLWGAGMPVRPPDAVHCWHSDVESAATDAPMVSVWIGIDNTCRESGLEFVSRSHRFGVSLQQERNGCGMDKHAARAADVIEWARVRDERSELVVPDISDGEAVFFHGHLWHRSRNASSRTRTALLLQYATPDARIRIPDRDHLDWPFRQLAEPRPACVMIKGRDTAGVNRFVEPPEPPGRRFHTSLTERVVPYRIPLPGGAGRGWKPCPLFAGRTGAGNRLTCHVAALSPGRTPHSPHRHDEEELLVMLHGEVEIVLPDSSHGGAGSRLHLERGDFVYYPAQFSHTLASIGSENANYLMFKWRGQPRSSDHVLQFQKHNVYDVVGAVGAKQGFRPRRVYQDGTRFLAALNCHVSTLTPGAGYEPHVDPYDVALVLFQGEVEALGERLRDNGVMFFPKGVPHGLRNTGDTTAVYLVFEFHDRDGVRDSAMSAPNATQRDAPAPARAGSRTRLPAGDATAGPIFVMGCGRSGTTLMQRVINAAPDAAVSGEHNGFLRPLAEAYLMQKAKGCSRSTAQGSDFQSEIRLRLKNPKVWPGWTNAYREGDVTRHYAELISNCIGPAWIGARRWGFKEIRYGGDDGVIEMLLELFPNGRFVFVVRNPVDVIASQRLCAFGESEDLIDDWIAKNEAFSVYAGECPDRCRIVRYEDLVDSPRETVEALYDWLELQGAHAGAAVVNLPEGRYAMRARGRLPRELLSGERLLRIFTRTSALAAHLELPLPVLVRQAEDVPVKLGRDGARIGPFADGRLIQCDAVVLGLWALCDGRRDVRAIVSEMTKVAGQEDVRAMLDHLLGLNALALEPAGGS